MFVIPKLYLVSKRDPMKSLRNMTFIATIVVVFSCSAPVKRSYFASAIHSNIQVDEDGNPLVDDSAIKKSGLPERDFSLADEDPRDETSGGENIPDLKPAPVKPSPKKALGTFEQAKLLYENSKYQEALDIVETLVQHDDSKDSSFYEKRFLQSECLAELKYYDRALFVLNDIGKGESAPFSLREKSLLRKGHVQCASGKSLEAEMTFKSFKVMYPNSRYLTLATCAVMKK